MRDATIRVEAPLALDVASNLIRAVGAMYPNATISTRAGYALSMTIPEEDRVEAADTVDVREAVDIEKVGADEDDLEYLGTKDDTLSISTPEDANRLFAQIAITLLADPDIANYVETTATTPDGERYVLIATRGPGATPHQLRQQADQRAERLLAELDTISADAETLLKATDNGRTRKALRQIIDRVQNLPRAS